MLRLEHSGGADVSHFVASPGVGSESRPSAPLPMMPTTPMELITTLGMLYIGAEYAHTQISNTL